MDVRIPDSVTKAYIDILHHGFQILQDAESLGLANWSLAELDHLHNVPSLLFEDNRSRHVYYYEIERKIYLDRIAKISSEQLHRRVELFYVPNWNVVYEFAIQNAS